MYCYILYIEAVGSWLQKIPCKSMEAKYPGDLANLEPRGMVGMIYVGNHKTLLYTKYIWVWNRRFLKFFQL